MENAKNNQPKLTRDGSSTLLSGRFGVTYHSMHGARTESEHVFIRHGLDYMLQQKAGAIRVFEMGFGTGLNAFLSALRAEESQREIHYTGIEQFPLEQSEVRALNYGSEKQDSFLQLHDCEWNKIDYITKHFVFSKHFTALEDFQPTGLFDVIYFDAFAPATQPDLWTREIFETMHAFLDRQGILVTYCAQGQMKRNLAAAGFRVETLPGPPGKREMTRAHKM